MEEYKELISSLREAIISLRVQEYPEDISDQEQEVLAPLIKLRYSTIDMACAVLQGSEELVEQFPSSELREKIEEIVSSLSSVQAKQIIKSILGKIDAVRSLTQILMTHPDRYIELEASVSLSRLTETVYKAHGQLDAESMHLFLETYGFPNRILQESAGIVLALTVGKLGEAEIRVAPEDANQAKKYIEAMKTGVFMLSDLEERHLESIFEVVNDQDLLVDL